VKPTFDIEVTTYSSEVTTSRLKVTTFDVEVTTFSLEVTTYGMKVVTSCVKVTTYDTLRYTDDYLVSISDLYLIKRLSFVGGASLASNSVRHFSLPGMALVPDILACLTGIASWCQTFSFYKHAVRVSDVLPALSA
jgi:hypothetical protein